MFTARVWHRLGLPTLMLYDTMSYRLPPALPADGHRSTGGPSGERYHAPEELAHTHVDGDQSHRPRVSPVLDFDADPDGSGRGRKGRVHVIRRYGGVLRLALMATDGALAMIVSLAIYQGFAHPTTSLGGFLDVFWPRALVYSAFWVVLLYVNGAYRLRAHWTLVGEVRSVVRATIWMAVLGTAALLARGLRPGCVGLGPASLPPPGHARDHPARVVRSGFMYLRHHGFNVRNLLVLGSGAEAVEFTRLVQEHSVLGVQVVGYLGADPPAGTPAGKYWGSFEALPEVLATRVVDEVAICVSEAEWSIVEPLAQLATNRASLSGCR